nr:phosphomannomutase [uncultured Cohaesibacter sp.]
MDVKFGTSGLRGLSVELTGMPSALYMTAFCRFLEEKGLAKQGETIFVGRDLRPSSPEIASICFASIKACGFKPLDCGVLPTPALALHAMAQNAASIMITGSHIPADRNGIKFYVPAGEITKQDEQAIIAWAEKLDGSVSLEKSSAENDEGKAIAAFMQRGASILPENAFEGKKIGVYQHSTTCREMLVDCLKGFGADVIPLGWSDTFIPVDTEAVSDETVALLQGWAKEFSLDAVVSADGDADRPLVADETGTPLRGDLLGLITSNFLRAKVAVTPITSNSGIEKNSDFEVIRTKVGSPYVIAGMAEAISQGKENIVGFEANGGYLTATSINTCQNPLSALPTRDCFLPILATLFSAFANGKSLTELSADYSLPVADADRIKNFAQERSAALMSHLRESDEALASFLAPIGEVASKTNVDGLRITLKSGDIVHFRPSGNAPEMRCYVEAESEKAAAQLLQNSLQLLESYKSSS